MSVKLLPAQSSPVPREKLSLEVVSLSREGLAASSAQDTNLFYMGFYGECLVCFAD